MKWLIVALAFFSFMFGAWLTVAVCGYSLGVSEIRNAGVGLAVVDCCIVGFLLRAAFKKINS